MPTRPALLPAERLTLADLVSQLDRLGDVPRLEQVTHLLARTRLTPDEWTTYVQFDEARYRRNLVFRCERFEALVLCWRPGQNSPIHDHHGSECAFAVLGGTGMEIRFAWDAAKRLSAVSFQPLPVGTIAASIDSDLHVVANWAQPIADLVTLHIYSPPLTDMRIYKDAGVLPVRFDQLQQLEPPPVRPRWRDLVRLPQKGGAEQ